MNKRLLLLTAIIGASQLVLANIATDFANGVEPMPATEGAKAEGVLPEDAVVQLIAEGVESTEAVQIVRIVYGLTRICHCREGIAKYGRREGIAAYGRCREGIAAYDGVVTAALNTLLEGADPAPLSALFSHCPPTPGTGSGGGGSVSPS